MSQSNVEAVRRAYEHFRATGEVLEDFVAPDMVWDMSGYRGWVEGTEYHGTAGAHEIVEDWSTVWDRWELEPDEFLEAGDKVIVITRQHSRSELTNVPVTAVLAQVWTVQGGKATRMEGYSDPADALRACARELTP